MNRHDERLVTLIKNEEYELILAELIVKILRGDM